MALTIGQLATAADVNIQTVRYYERQGLVPAPRRSASGYRQYPDGVVRRIRFIKRVQGLGFSLKEIQELLALRVRPGSSADAVKRTTYLKIECIEQKIRRLQRIKHALEQLAPPDRALCEEEAVWPMGDTDDALRHRISRRPRR